MRKNFSIESSLSGSQPDGRFNYSLSLPKRVTSVTACSVLLLAGAVMSQFAVAQNDDQALQAATGALLDDIVFDVDRIEVVGDNPLSAAETQALIAPFLGKNKSISDIELVADAFTAALREKGLTFYRASFLPQELTDGVLELNIKRYKLGKISVNGNKHYSANNIVSSLPHLKSGSSPSTWRISRSLRIANQNGSKQVRLSLAPGELDDEIDARLLVKDLTPRRIRAWINNYGTDDSGDFRVGASLSHGNLFDRDHSGSINFVTSPEGVDDVQQFAATYKIPLYSLGGAINFTAVNSDIDTGTVAGVFEVAGRGEVYGVGYSHTLQSIEEYHHNIGIQLTDKLFDNDVTFQGAQLLGDLRSRPLSITYSGNLKPENGPKLAGSISYSTNLSGGSFNTDEDYAASRSDASQSWSKVDIGVSVDYALDDWLFTGAFKAGFSDERLITGEQFSLGGATSIRGMDERELRGDEGYLLNLQAWAPQWSKSLRPVWFLDAGRIKNKNATSAEIDSETVVSIGLLMNWNPTDRISTTLSYGYLLDGIDSPEAGIDISEDGDSKLHVNVNYRF
ncbi:MAG: ShlB/FhaC/HecB family hemolysin secretion/activation protein [Pseudomonadota bacterium]